MPRSMSSIGSVPRERREPFALWNLGFRPFYLLASIFAAVSILLWIATYAGVLPGGYLRDPVCPGAGRAVHFLRKATTSGAESRKNRCSDSRICGFAPVSVEYGSIRSVGA